MNATVDAALALWGLSGASYELVAARENAVYRVTTGTGTYALRLHRAGYRSDAELTSELLWMDAVGTSGVSVPAPVAAKSGAFLHCVDGVQVDVLSWLPGDTLDTLLPQSNNKTQLKLFHDLGREMARLHAASDRWQPPDQFTRCVWDRDGLVGQTPLWGKFWDNPELTPHDRDLLISFRDRAYGDLATQSETLDYGLIHADLVGANVMANDTDLLFIDFDDGGHGYRIFDVATALFKHADTPDYERLKRALTDGYRTIRSIDLSSLELFMALRAATYVGWNITRMDEDNGQTRNARFVKSATLHAAAYLNGR